MPALSLSKATGLLEAFVAGEDPPALWKAWIALPDGLDQALVAEAFERVLLRPHDARVVGRGLNPSYLDAFLAALSKHRWPEAIAATCLDGDSPKKRAQQLSEVFRMLGQLGVFSISRSQERERIRAFSSDRVFIEAARRLVVAQLEWESNREWVPSALIAALMEDASPESIDALLPVVDRAVKGSGELDLLRRRLSEVREPKPSLEPLRALLENSATGREGPKVRRELSRLLGFEPPPKSLKFKWSETALRGRVMRLEIRLVVDCDRDPFFRVVVRRPAGEGSSVFTSRGPQGNALELPVLERLSEWPKWAASVRHRVNNVRWERALEKPTPRAAMVQSALTKWLGG